MQKLSVVLQAGGKSSRMGREKGLVEFQGRPLLAFILEQVEKVGNENLIISNNPEDYAQFGLPVYPDVIPDIGALGGIYSALYYSSHDICLILACDMPFVNLPLLEHMLALASDYDLVMPRWKPEEFAEPFRAVYKKSCLAPIKKAIEAGERRVISFVKDVEVHYVAREEIERFDPQGRSFFNINTPEDLTEAVRMVQGSSG